MEAPVAAGPTPWACWPVCWCSRGSLARPSSPYVDVV